MTCHSAVRFKVIPLDPNSNALIKLVVIRQSHHAKEDKYKSTKDLQLEHSTIEYPILGANVDSTTENFRNYMNGRQNYKNWLTIRNGTSNSVLVLSDVVSTGKIKYENTVWLPGEDRMCVGAHGAGPKSNLCSAFKFTVYRISDLQGKSLPDRVRELFCQLVGTGNPGLHASGATTVCHFIFRTHVKTWKDNNISIAEFAPGDGNAEFVEGDGKLSEPKGLWEALGRQKIFEKKDGTFYGNNLKMETRIEGKGSPSGHVRVYDR